MVYYTEVKKIRVKIKKGFGKKKIPVFNSPESLYVWLHDPELNNVVDLDPSLGTTLFLKEGETLEAEWMGFECVYDNKKFLFNANLIRLAKDIKTNVKIDKPIVGIYEGWITSSILDFRSYSKEEIQINKLTNKSRHKFDIQELFDSRESIINEAEEFPDEELDENSLVN